MMYTVQGYIRAGGAGATFAALADFSVLTLAGWGVGGSQGL